MVAGIHPIKVICNSKQMMPAIGRPIVKNVIQGNKKAINNRIMKSVVDRVLIVSQIILTASDHSLLHKNDVIKTVIQLDGLLPFY